MKPDFALSLSFQGIRLLHRAAGGWRIVGEVAPTADDLTADLAVLRKSATALEPGGLRTKLLLPDEQIRYLTIDTPDMAEAARRDAARKALDGATPYAVDDLAFDISLDGPRTHVAAVARETLAEAEAFAIEHRLHPVSFAAVPGDQPYLGEPYFGQTEAAADLLEEGESVEADGIAVVVIGDVAVPDGPVAAVPEPAKAEPPKPSADEAPQAIAHEAEPAKAPVDAPDETPALTKPAHAAAAPAVAQDAPPVEVAPVSSDPADTEKGAATAEPDVPEKADTPKPDKAAAPAPAVPPAPQDASPIRQDTPDADLPEAAETAPASSPSPEPEETAIAQTPDVAVKIPAAPVAAPAAAAPPIGAAPLVSTPAPEHALSENKADAVPAKETADADTPEDAEAAQDVPVMPPLRAARAEKAVPAAPLPPLRAEPSGFASRRGGSATPTLQGARREPQVGTPAARQSAQDAVIRPDSSSLDSPAPPAEGATPTPDPAPTRSGFLSRRRNTESKPDKAVVPAPMPLSGGAAVSEAERMTIFGARKSEVGGKPRFLGLILTAVLLVFLAGVAAWASVFLDDGLSLSRLFGTRPAPEVAAVPDTPSPEQTAPETEDPVQTAALDSGLTEEDGAVLDALRTPEPMAELDLTQAELEAKYAATGIWPRAPVVPPEPAAEVAIEDLYLTSIDPVSSAADAIALPAPDSLLTDTAFGEVANPTAAGTRFALDENGLVIPTTEGTVNPEGVTIYLGRPEIMPPDAIMARYQPQTEQAEETPVLDVLAAFRPRTRPGGLVESAERAQFDGLTLDELAQYRPALRPQSLQEQAAAAAETPAVNPADTADAVAEALETADQPDVSETPNIYAVAASARPAPRPRNFDRVVQRADRAAPAEETRVASAASTAPRAVTPSIPSKTSVARQATVKNAINLRRVNLIGVYGKPSSRRALVRLSNGRYRKVEVGDRIDGGRVSAIGDGELRYTKGGRSVVLKMPRG